MKFITDIVPETLAEEKIETAEPSRPKLRQETADPIATKLITERFEESREHPRREIALPIAQREITLIIAPTWSCPWTERADPTLVKQRNDSEDPSLTQLSADIVELSRA